MGRRHLGGQLFWLTGQAGSGKTTIAYTIAQHFDGLEKMNILDDIPSWAAPFFAPANLKRQEDKFILFPPLYISSLESRDRTPMLCMNPTSSTRPTS